MKEKNWTRPGSRPKALIEKEVDEQDNEKANNGRGEPEGIARWFTHQVGSFFFLLSIIKKNSLSFKFLILHD